MKPSLLIPLVALALTAYAKKPIELGGIACQTPPPSHCPDANCPGSLAIEDGTAIEPKSGRKFFLDYPCDLKKGEKVTFILLLHGFGSYGNWQRHYFPILDFKEKYRLVIATPNASAAPPKAWAAVDDDYLQGIVTMVYDQIGKDNIKTFWLAGHSQGGITTNRIIRTDFFKQRVDGFLSLSGGRLGGNPGRGNFANLAVPRPSNAAVAPTARPSAGSQLPANQFSFIYETGQNEMDTKGMPETSEWAEKLGCGARIRKPDVVDTKAGYVYDSTRQNPGSDAWGHLPRPGTAEVFEYPRCKSGLIVADVVRESKGHTEGLEPHITEQLIKLMLSAKKTEKGN
jgi:hypothetical protein